MSLSAPIAKVMEGHTINFHQMVNLTTIDQKRNHTMDKQTEHQNLNKEIANESIIS